MRNILTSLFVLFSLHFAHAAIDSMVLVQGHIESSESKSVISVTDLNGQKLTLPRSAFPKKFSFKQGSYFSVEVTDKVFDSLNRPKTKKNR